MSMKGRISSFQSLGTVDGPGVRSVIFLQGCPLRCVCCHNPETWDPALGEETDTETLVRKVLRFRSYFGEKGGVTLSGGEPLLQAPFSRELFRAFHKAGIHTALDTSGCIINDDVLSLLSETDLVLLDRKYPNEEDYFRYTGMHLSEADRFLALLEERKIPTWIRRVIIPGLNDTVSSAEELRALSGRFSCIEKTELLPFRKFCIEKYDSLGISFPLKDTPEASEKDLEPLYKVLADDF